MNEVVQREKHYWMCPILQGAYGPPDSCHHCNLITRARQEERRRIVTLLTDNYGPTYSGPVNLDAVLRIIGPVTS